MAIARWIAVRRNGRHITYAVAEGDPIYLSTYRGRAKRFDTKEEAEALFSTMTVGEAALWRAEEVDN